MSTLCYEKEKQKKLTLARTTNFFGGIGLARCLYSLIKSFLDLLLKCPWKPEGNWKWMNNHLFQKGPYMFISYKQKQVKDKKKFF